MKIRNQTKSIDKRWQSVIGFMFAQKNGEMSGRDENIDKETWGMRKLEMQEPC